MKRARLPIVLVLGLLPAICSAEAEFCNAGDRDLLYVPDMRDIPDGRRRDVFAALAQITAQEDWRSIGINAPTDLRRIVHDYFNVRVNTQTYQLLQQWLADLIGLTNRLTSPTVPSSVIRVPYVPVLPEANATPDLVQIVTTGRVRVVERKLALSKPLTATPLAQWGNGAAGLVVPLTRRTRRALSTMVDAAFYCELVLRVADKPAMGVVEQSDTAAEPTEFLRDLSIEQVRRELSALRVDGAGLSYFIDDFAGECSHGQKVLEVFVESLEAYGAKHLARNLRGIDLRWDASDLPVTIKVRGVEVPITAAAKILAEHERDLVPFERKHLHYLMKLEQQELDSKFSFVLMSAAFERALYESRTSLISTSIYARGLTGSLIPMGHTAQQLPLLFGAVSQNAPYVELATTEEPTRTFVDLMLTGGVALVNSAFKTPAGVRFGGMPSLMGRNIRYVSRGSGYGDANTCIRRTDQGQSFATPYSAAQAYLALSYFQSVKRQPLELFEPLEFLSRMQLASDVQPDLVGLIGSAGVPQMARVMHSTDDYLVRNDDSVERITIRKARLGATTVLEAQPVGELRGQPIFIEQPIDQLEFANQWGKMRGLQIVGKRVFIYRQGRFTWEEIGRAAPQLQVIYDTHDGRSLRIKSLRQFTKHYKGVYKR